MSMDSTSEISAYVEQTLIEWIKQYPSFESTQTLTELSDGKFFLTILESLPNFKLLHPIIELTNQPNLAAKVIIIKNIAKSLIKYHQTQLLRDVSELEINYVELCMGNKKQLFRLITILLSAVYSQENSRVNIQHTISKLLEDQSQVIRIMIQNSLNLGQQCTSCETRSWRLTQQKKLFNKMQSLQNKIQQLEITNKTLQDQIKSLSQQNQITNQSNQKLKTQLQKLLTFNTQLTDLNQKNLNDLKLSSIQQTKANKKLELTKKKLQEKINKYQKQIQILANQKQYLQKNMEKIKQLTSINQQIQQQNQYLRNTIIELEKQKICDKKSVKNKNQQIIKLKQHCSNLQIKLEQLSLSLLCQSKSNNPSLNKPPSFTLQDSSDSNRYRIKQTLHWLNNPNNYTIQSDLNTPSSQQPSNDPFQIKTITQRSIEDSSSYLQHVQQNQSIFINNSEMIFKSEQPHSSSLHPYSNQNQQYTNNINKSSPTINQPYKQQIHLLTCIIIDLQTQLEHLRKLNPILIMENNSITKSRMAKFSQKVKDMFKKKQDKQKDINDHPNPRNNQNCQHNGKETSKKQTQLCLIR